MLRRVVCSRESPRWRRGDLQGRHGRLTAAERRAYMEAAQEQGEASESANRQMRRRLQQQQARGGRPGGGGTSGRKRKRR